MSSIEIIQDCQWGSTGKGLFAHYLGRQHQPDLLAMAPSPNAGHTFIIDGDVKMIHRMLPCGIDSKNLKKIILGPGSLIDMDALYAEIKFARSIELLKPEVKVFVHRAAAVVLDRHRDAEAHGNTAPGSTRKGVGAAQAERIRRHPEINNVIGLIKPEHPLFNEIELIDTHQLQMMYLEADKIQLEGCQGYSLSIYHGEYPYVTCRDVTATSLLADCGMPLRRNSSINVYGVFRTYPIRVANRPDAGEWSGPTYSDSKEITFDSLGQSQELTTVTKLPRRIFTFSYTQAVEACVQNRIDFAFLNFCQYCPDWPTLRDIWLRLEEATIVRYMGFGPRASDVVKVGSPTVNEDHIKEIYERTRATI